MIAIRYCSGRDADLRFRSADFGYIEYFSNSEATMHLAGCSSLVDSEMKEGVPQAGLCQTVSRPEAYVRWLNQVSH